MISECILKQNPRSYVCIYLGWVFFFFLGGGGVTYRKSFWKEKHQQHKFFDGLVQFNSIQDGIYALGKAHNMRSAPSFRSVPNVAFENGSNVRLIDYGPLSSFQGRSSSASSFLTSLLQAIDGVMSLALCPAGSVSSFSTLPSFREASHF